MDQEIIGVMRVGYFRIGIFTDHFDKMLTQYQKLGLEFTATKRELALGERDTKTGWRSINWQTSTIDILIFERGSSAFNLPPGAYVRTDALGITLDPCKEGDQIYWANKYYEVEAVRPIYIGDSLIYYYYDLVKLPLYQASFSSTATWKTSPYDASYLTRVIIETYVRDAQITKDDGSSNANWASFFENPPYPLALEFSKVGGIDCAYVLGEATSIPEVSGDQIVRRYQEKIPIHVCTMDREGVTGRAMKHKMVSELRYVLETYPIGSQRVLEEGRSNDRALGSMWLYDQTFTLSYKRGTA